jgi:hypothetical protein
VQERSGNQKTKSIAAELTPGDDGSNGVLEACGSNTAFQHARVRAQLGDRREVVTHEVRGPRSVRGPHAVQRATGCRVGLRRQRSTLAAGGAAAVCADPAEHPHLALVAAATGWREGAGEHADHHHALQRHHRHASEQATAALDHVCVLRIEGGEIDVGPGVIIILRSWLGHWG